MHPPAGDVLEQAVFLSVRLQDEAAFERNYLQLKTYYTDTRQGCPQSSVPHPALEPLLPCSMGAAAPMLHA